MGVVNQLSYLGGTTLYQKDMIEPKFMAPSLRNAGVFRNGSSHVFATATPFPEGGALAVMVGENVWDESSYHTDQFPGP